MEQQIKEIQELEAELVKINIKLKEYAYTPAILKALDNLNCACGNITEAVKWMQSYKGGE